MNSQERESYDEHDVCLLLFSQKLSVPTEEVQAGGEDFSFFFFFGLLFLFSLTDSLATHNEGLVDLRKCPSPSVCDGAQRVRGIIEKATEIDVGG